LTVIFAELGLIIAIAGVVAYLARTLKQPLIPAYILAGILLGPVLGAITDAEVVEALSELGIAFLLFGAGLELNLKKIKEVGSASIVGALAHMAILFTVGFFAFKLMHFPTSTDMYAGFVLLFSSTLVVVKLLSDKRELDTLHGRIILGILLVQDLVAIIVLSVLNTAGKNLAESLVYLFGQGIIVLIVGYFMAKITFERVFKFAARNDELLFVLTMTILFLFALIYTQIGFSVAIGAFVAGLLLGQLPYKYEMISQIKMLKEFFAIIFFVSVGLAFTPVNPSDIAIPFLVLLFLIVFGIPTVIMLALSIMGFKKRTSFLSAITLIQVSEFSLIFVRVGLDHGQVSADFFNIIILLSLVTLTLTTYVIKYDEKLYSWIGRRLDFMERLALVKRNNYEFGANAQDPKIILVGYDRIGFAIFKKLRQIGKPALIIDINPDIIKKLVGEQTPCLYGDIGDIEILERLQLEKIETIISTVPNLNETALMIEAVRKRNPAATIIVTAYEADEAMFLYDKGADYVIVPHFLGGEHLSVILEELTGSIGKRIKIKVAHMKALKDRRKQPETR